MREFLTSQSSLNSAATYRNKRQPCPRNYQQLWQHVQSFKDRYRLRELFDRDYGMTEFHIIDPNSCLVFVGETTSPTTGAPQ